MKAVVLAGGQEFGQSPLSRQMPRALWPFVDRPLIEHVLSALHAAGVGDMAISANGRTHEIADRLGRHPRADIRIHYSQDALPRGAAGCIKDCQGFLGEERFVVAHGASVMLEVDFARLVEEHRQSQAILTVAASADAPEAQGGAGVFPLKPAGIYVCEPEVLAYINPRGYQDMKEQLIPHLAEKGLKVHATTVRGRVLPILNEECYLGALLEVLDDEQAARAFTHHLPARCPGIWVEQEALIHARARLIGPVYVARGAAVLAEAVVIGPAVIGPECQVGPNAIVHESILWPGARLGSGALVEQTVVAANAVVAPGREVRSAIVVDASLSLAERQSLAPGTEFVPLHQGGLRRLVSRIWSNLRPVLPAG